MIRQTADAARRAAVTLSGRVERTPLRRAAVLSAELGADVYCKLENRQATGSFKLRGATNRLLTLESARRARGCVAASSGNHGAAVARAARRLGIDALVFVPEHTAGVKVDRIRADGAEVRFVGTDGLDAELHARAYADEHDRFYVSPYNDPEVVAGQGSIGVEILEERPDVDAVFAAVGGGGLISGVGSVLKDRGCDVRVYGCQPLASPVMLRSIEAGRIVTVPSEPTLSDGTAGGIEENAITFGLSRAVVDDWVVVDEEQIGAAMRRYADAEGEVVEGAAGVAVASLYARRDDIAGQVVAVVVCGGNVDGATARRVGVRGTPRIVDGPSPGS